MEHTIIMRSDKVLLDSNKFRSILRAMRKNDLIKEFAEDRETASRWKKLTKAEIISTIFIKYEE